MSTLERMARIETNIDYIKQILEETNTKLDATNNKIDSFIDCADKKYATCAILNLCAKPCAHNSYGNSSIKTRSGKSPIT